MAEKIVDDKKLSTAIEQAESTKSELQKHKTDIKSKDVAAKQTISQTVKQGDKTIRKTITKSKKHKTPTEFKNHPMAHGINNLIDYIVEEKGVGERCEFGEAVVLTIDFYLSDVPDHPLLYLGFAGAMVGFAYAKNKTDWLNPKKEQTQQGNPAIIIPDNKGTTDAKK